MFTQGLCIVCVLFLFGVNSMSLKGPRITRYDPCGLGMIHFDKLKDKVWQGVLNLGILNTNGLNGIEIQIDFEKRIALFEATQNTTLSVKNNDRDYNIKIPSNVPKVYVFYIAVIETGVDVPIVKRFSINNRTLCDDTIKDSQNVNKFNVTKLNDTKYRHVCGRRSLDHTELTSVRTIARAGDWPWHAAIVVKERITNIDRYQCGGNIISTTAVLTAGHCVSKNGINVDAWRITILVGISNLTDLKQSGRQVHNAVQVILHPAFSDVQATADLAIIKVTSFRFTEYVQPVCIWGPVYDKSSLFGKEAIVVGFGTTEDNKLSDTLRSAYTIVQNDFTCIAYSPKLYTSLLNEFTFCAGYGPSSNVNPRNGDSGGGLVVATVQSDFSVSWFLRGIVSKCGVSPGHTQCDPKFYLVYTDVAPHYGWIYHNAGLQYSSNVL
ncbi:PREDICTED: serine protease gd-like [Papilio polytes]|uniref:serine protease gd-like n=1 Tax=Papilio polytes TaxID=76194 RepID=UPI0006767547|nr:PREDICTED: serine protease gd-like [Papilio polytes]